MLFFCIKVPGRPISRILCRRQVCLRTVPAVKVIYLVRMLPSDSSSLPEAQGKRAASRLPKKALPLLGFAPTGGYLAAALLQTPVVSYTTISPLPLRAVVFCGPIRQVALPRVLPDSVPCGVRTFLETVASLATFWSAWLFDNNCNRFFRQRYQRSPKCVNF